MGSLPDDRPRSKRLSLEERVQQIKNGLVLRAAAERGPFFEELREIRARWGIEAQHQLPPEDHDLLYPEKILRVLRGEANPTEQHIYDMHNWGQDIESLWMWLAVPGLERYRLAIDWWPFTAALILYRPPGGTLQEFAKYGGVVRKEPLAEFSRVLRRKNTAAGYDPSLVSPLVGESQNPHALVQVWQAYYETLMEEINRRFLRPQGLDIHEMKYEVLKDGTLDESREERISQIPYDFGVKVPKDTAVDDIREAAELAVRMRKESEKATESVKASDTELKKAEIAYRRDDGQSYKSLEERYSNMSVETLKTYARNGRKILNGAG